MSYETKNVLSFKREINSNLEGAIDRLTSALNDEGFGVLTRIDLHSKIKEAIGKDLRPVVILGVCNPQLAFDAYQYDPEVVALLPCNAVIRDIADGCLSVELTRPSSMMKILDDKNLIALAKEADVKLERVLEMF